VSATGAISWKKAIHFANVVPRCSSKGQARHRPRAATKERTKASVTPAKACPGRRAKAGKPKAAATLDPVFQPVAAAYAKDPEVGLGRMFSSNSVLNVNGKIFAMFVRGSFGSEGRASSPRLRVGARNTRQTTTPHSSTTPDGLRIEITNFRVERNERMEHWEAP
jgi:hypothetical protein